MKFALRIGFILSISILLQLTACNSDSGTATGNTDAEPTLVAENPRLKLHSWEESGLDFVNEIEESHESNPTNNINIYNGGGVAVADVNNDGLPDIYFINCSGKNKLFLNQGSFTFKDVTDGSGLESADGFETCVTAVDINSDGWMDFYVGRAGPYEPEGSKNRLFINNGAAANGLTFTEKAADYGLDVGCRTTGANFFDYDLDGDLDVYILNYPQSFDYTAKIEARLNAMTQEYEPYLKPRTEWDSDRLYRNNGDGTFTNVSQQAGIETFAYGLSVTVSDFNGDHYPDIYVGNDFIQPDILYINNQNGTFTNQLDKYVKHITQHTMGVDIADFDNDQQVDLVAVDMLPRENYRQKSTLNTSSQSRYNSLTEHGYFEAKERNVLQHNNGNRTLSDIGCVAGVFKTDWSWSSLFMDMDNDGYKDLAITNGYRREVTDMDFVNFTFADIKKSGKIKDQFSDIQDLLKLIPSYKLRNYVYRNRGDWTFEDMGGKWLTVPASWSNGAAYADFDRDGDLDWVMNNLVDKPFLYENLTRSMPNSNYLQLLLVGEGGNNKAVGASATITVGNQQQYQELYPTRGIFSSVEHLLHFGLGKAEKVDKLVLRWPDGRTTTLTDIPANQRLTLKQAEANGQDAGTETPATATLMQEATKSAGINFAHQENVYLDFDAYFLQPWKESDHGPFTAKGDVNGDGLDDLFIGNAFGQPAALYAQGPDGRFRSISTETWKQDAAYEDHGGLFFDADGDGDLDLLVISGGAEADPKFGNQAWQNRLYINLDGKGNFAKTENTFPENNFVGGRATAYDYDSDGDLDLFIGSRVFPTRWPLTPQSTVLRNDRTHFTDVTDAVAPEFRQCGMVSDLSWADLDGDKQPELLVTGEWMPIMVFKLQQGNLKNVTGSFGLDKSNGLWNRLIARDLDNDGDLDLVAGNFGLNTRLVASGDEPMRCYANDFDGNGSIDPLITTFEEGKEYPIVRQDALIKQLPALKKKFIKSKDYGKARIDDVYPREKLEGLEVLDVYTLATSWWENKDGRFIQHVLPLQAQIAPAIGVEVLDVNGDGNLDIMMAGNKYGIEVSTGRCDAGIGAVFLGDGRGGFRWLPTTASGFFAPGEARDLVALRGSGGKMQVVVTNNNAPVQVFRLNANVSVQ
ncbi:MAG: hypothetical protein EP344_07640 [Bacteroidetes bacterium]|nr:MAG: hypothetical protein EP344_07640 [Bacteroidota bacterium]